jgi:hypothetical protein
MFIGFIAITAREPARVRLFARVDEMRAEIERFISGRGEHVPGLATTGNRLFLHSLREIRGPITLNLPRSG